MGAVRSTVAKHTQYYLAADFDDRDPFLHLRAAFCLHFRLFLSAGIRKNFTTRSRQTPITDAEKKIDPSPTAMMLERILSKNDY